MTTSVLAGTSTRYVQGPPGLGRLHGNGPPSNTLGRNGETYTDDLTRNVYAKTGGVWTATGRKDGKSAFDYAFDAGYSGTEEDFGTSLDQAIQSQVQQTFATRALLTSANVASDIKLIQVNAFSSTSVPAPTRWRRVASAPAIDPLTSDGGTVYWQRIDDAPPIQALAAVKADDATDDLAAVAAAVASNPTALTLPASNMVMSDTVTGNGVIIRPTRSARIRRPNSDPDLGHAQTVKGIISPDAQIIYDKLCAQKANLTIATIGDSLTAHVDTVGRVGTGQGSFRAILADKLARCLFLDRPRVRGDGEPGNNAAQIRANLPNYWTLFGMQYAVLEIGPNDVNDYQTRTADMYRADMVWIIEYLLTRGVRLCVLGIPGFKAVHDPNGILMPRVHAFNSVLKELCDIYGLRFVSITALSQSDPGYIRDDDGLHWYTAFNEFVAGLLYDAFLADYGLPNETGTVTYVSRGDTADPTTWNLPGVYYLQGQDLVIAQTGDVHVRRRYPWCVRLLPGTVAGFKADGPMLVLVCSKSPGILQVNGTDTTLLNGQATQAIGFVTSRFDGSSANFTIAAKADPDPSKYIEIVGIINFRAAPAHNYHVLSVTAARNGIYVPYKLTMITDGVRRMLTIMQPLAVGTFFDVGLDPQTGLQNVGSQSQRVALGTTMADFIPHGFRFYDLDNLAWYAWNGTTKAWVLLT